jgi:DNA-binding transcriptional MerR regulator
MKYTIKQAAERTGLSPYVLRYYEREGLLSPVERSKSGIRRYSQEDLDWLGLVCCLKNTGMSLKQIKVFVDLSAQGGQTLKRRCELLAAHKKNVEAQIQQMQEHLGKVSWKIDYFTRQYEEYEAAKAQRPKARSL